MTLRKVARHQPSQQPPDLVTVVQRFQHLHRQWEAATVPGNKAHLFTELGACQDELWRLLANPLFHLARRWLYSGFGHDMIANSASYPARNDVLNSISLSLYLPILEALPHIQVDLDKNLLGYLLCIAKNGISDEHRKIYSHRSHRKHHTGTSNQPLPGTQDAAMSPSAGQNMIFSSIDTNDQDIADPDSDAFTIGVINAIHHQQCWPIVEDFWQRTLKPVDWQILKQRLKDPPLEHAIIAQQIGQGWTEAAIRQRYARIIRRTRDQLRVMHLLDET